MDFNQKNFKKAHEWTRRLRNRYLYTLATFRIYERFRKLVATNIVGKRKAEANAKLFGDNIYFFNPITESTRISFFIELAKFFDENKRRQSLTLDILLNFVKKNISSFSKIQFEKFNDERKNIPGYFEDYKPITLKDTKRLQKRIKRNGQLIENLKKYRDRFLAHDDIKKGEIKITGPQIKVLLRLIKDTIDLFNEKLEGSSYIYRNYDEEPIYAVDRVVKDLQEYEKERIRRIEEKYKI